MNSSARPSRMAAVLGAALLVWGASGCEQRTPSSPPAAPVPAPSAGDPTGPSGSVSRPGSEGLTVRYLDADGKIQRLDVEDFPR